MGCWEIPAFPHYCIPLTTNVPLLTGFHSLHFTTKDLNFSGQLQAWPKVFLLSPSSLATFIQGFWIEKETKGLSTCNYSGFLNVENTKFFSFVIPHEHGFPKTFWSVLFESPQLLCIGSMACLSQNWDHFWNESLLPFGTCFDVDSQLALMFGRKLGNVCFWQKNDSQLCAQWPCLNHGFTKVGKALQGHGIQH